MPQHDVERIAEVSNGFHYFLREYLKNPQWAFHLSLDNAEFALGKLDAVNPHSLLSWSAGSSKTTQTPES